MSEAPVMPPQRTFTVKASRPRRATSPRNPIMPPQRRFTVKEYFRLVQVGILKEDDRTELIEGSIVQLSPPGPQHSWRATETIEIFVKRFSHAAFVRAQDPIVLGNLSAPQPDVALVSREAAANRQRHPTATDVLLAVEIADSSLRYDSGVKARLYAEHGVREFWIVDMNGGRLLAFDGPSAGGYRNARILQRGDSIEPQAFPGIAVAADDLLGPAETTA